VQEPKVVTSRVTTQKPITRFMKTSPAVGPNTLVPPSVSTAAPPPSPPEPQLPPSPAAGNQAQTEIIPVSSGQKGGSCSATKRVAPEEAKDKEEAKVTSADKAEAKAHDALYFRKNLVIRLTSLPRLGRMPPSSSISSQRRKMDSRAGPAERHASESMGQS
jgi:hypothetical protein